MSGDSYIQQALEAADKAPAAVAVALAAATTTLAFYPHISTYHNPWVVGVAVALDCLAVMRVAVAIAAWSWRRKAAGRGTFFLTPQEGRSVWGILTQADGRRTSFVHAELLAKNRTEEELYFARATLVRPNLGPTLRPLITISDGVSMNGMMARGAHVLKLDLAFDVVPDHKSAMDAILEVADSDGNAKKVKVRAAYLPTEASKAPVRIVTSQMPRS